ncbi:unnamed protein product [Nyctereutes procyonoides]|uniref:(raccoon dog) hypothetical protein n=1 Tax=Nyctereutes procyonoides TaxID=34880 RepID=A0A811ZTM7_NYCPR|nr:unnamed protein product [Nyctereutes procyonoides]
MHTEVFTGKMIPCSPYRTIYHRSPRCILPPKTQDGRGNPNTANTRALIPHRCCPRCPSPANTAEGTYETLESSRMKPAYPAAPRPRTAEPAAARPPDGVRTPPARGHTDPSVSRLPRADLPPRPRAGHPPRAAPPPPPAGRSPTAPPRRTAPTPPRTPSSPRRRRPGGGATRSARGPGLHYPQCLSAQRACAVASRLHRAAGDPRRWLRAALAWTPPLRDSLSLLGFCRRLTSARRPHRRYPGTREDTLQPSLHGERPRPASRSGLRGSRTALAASGRGSRRRGPRGGLSPGHPPTPTPQAGAWHPRGPRGQGQSPRTGSGSRVRPRGSPGPRARPRPPGTPPPAAARQGRPPRLSHSTVAPGRRLRPAARTKGREPAQGPPAPALPPALPTFPPASQPPRPRSPRPTNLIAEVTLNGARRDLTGGRRLGPPRAGRPAEGPPTLPAPRCPLDEREIDGGAPPPAGDGRAPSRGAEGALGAEARLPAVPQFTRLWRRRPCVRAPGCRPPRVRPVRPRCRPPGPAPVPARGRAHGSRPGRREPQTGEGTLELGPGRGAASRRAPGRRSAGRGAGRPS